jgi:hypothetical protein
MNYIDLVFYAAMISCISNVVVIATKKVNRLGEWMLVSNSTIWLVGLIGASIHMGFVADALNGFGRPFHVITIPIVGLIVISSFFITALHNNSNNE